MRVELQLPRLPLSMEAGGRRCGSWPAAACPAAAELAPPTLIPMTLIQPVPMLHSVKLLALPVSVNETIIE